MVEVRGGLMVMVMFGCQQDRMEVRLAMLTVGLTGMCRAQEVVTITSTLVASGDKFGNKYGN